MQDERADVIVLGGGTGGYATALRAAELNKSVVLIEKDQRLGGTCLLRGCVPTKALLRSAEVLDEVNRSETWGIKASGEPDWPGILSFQEKIVDKIVKGLTGLVRSRGIEVVEGTGHIDVVGGEAGEASVVVGERRISAGDLVLATGSFARTLPGTP